MDLTKNERALVAAATKARTELLDAVERVDRIIANPRDLDALEDLQYHHRSWRGGWTVGLGEENGAAMERAVADLECTDPTDPGNQP